MFSNQALKNLIIPLFLEQLLAAFVGIADVFVIGFVSEAAVSGVSLVNSFNTIFIFLFIALASGGAVIISQYIGKKDFDKAGETASQLLIFSILFSVVIETAILLYDAKLMRLIFGHVEKDVMDACVTYLRISELPCTGVLEKQARPCIFPLFPILSISLGILSGFLSSMPEFPGLPCPRSLPGSLPPLP